MVSHTIHAIHYLSFGGNAHGSSLESGPYSSLDGPVPFTVKAETERLASTSNPRPRRVIVGTSMEAFWVNYPGLPQRLEHLGAIIDKMAAESLKKHGRCPDVAVLPEVTVNGEAGEDAFAHAFPLEEIVKESFSRKALEHQCSSNRQPRSESVSQGMRSDVG